ncbi:hypothetical protein ABK905_03280 [Acerihabitans sp. KWT182]|uniref:Uncharacterized protein n=1 Tax=Acerihabitans sp. KWT182 TaxID=3157919 RepID=A0AAU7QCB9_9GAMM
MEGDATIVSLEERVRAETREVEAETPVTETEAEKLQKLQNLEECRMLLFKQITRDMVMQKNEFWDEWKKEWL